MLTQKVLLRKYVKEFNLRLNLGNGHQNPHFINVETEELSQGHTAKSAWTEEPGGLQSMGSQRVGHD